MTDAEDAAMVDDLRAWDARRTAERERAFAQLQRTWDEIMAKAQAGDDAHAEALAWSRQRIDLSAPQSFPLGKVKVSELKEYFTKEDDRALAEFDATLRGAVQVALARAVTRQ